MSHFTNLKEQIQNKSAAIVVIGVGYVGLPVAARFAEAGFTVTGLDVNKEKVALINQGICPIEGEEPGLADLVKTQVASGRLKASHDYAVCQQANIILIAVETPIDSVRQPRYLALRSALRTLNANLRPGTLVIVESTIAPGTTERLVLPILRANSRREPGRDFFLVHCPERVMPGRLLQNLRQMSRVVGGNTPEAAELGQALYQHIVEADLDKADCVTAELVKTGENAYRDVQIAFANELALICEQVGADVWTVRELINKSPGRNVLFPGAGVGGHCIPKDPWLLAYGASEMVQAKLIPAAREINDFMPLHVVNLTVDALEEAGLEIEQARVAILGFAYLEDSDDTRNSPSLVVMERLDELGAEVVVHDPWVHEYRGDLWETIEGCDAVVMMVKHRAYRELDLETLKGVLQHPVLIDGRHLFGAERAKASGFVYRGVGEGNHG
ncbi:MAG: nucleotide sugar dehydrogenase [Anaerolineae bacterium]|nr:nucleotide sugar dehydrogenase [Anaerolineae bacterium]